MNIKILLKRNKEYKQLNKTAMANNKAIANKIDYMINKNRL